VCSEPFETRYFSSAKEMDVFPAPDKPATKKGGMLLLLRYYRELLLKEKALYG
jgi:hypothetical protein